MSTTAPESTATESGVVASTAAPGAPEPVRYDPIMVVAAAGPANDPTFAIWQVETDPDVQLGDFSGAWLIDGAGIHGFAASADWIEGTDDRAAMLAALLRYPVLFVGDEAAAKVLPSDVALVDVAATEVALNDALASAKQHFNAEFPGKKQPAWGNFRTLEDFREDEAGGAGEGAGERGGSRVGESAGAADGSDSVANGNGSAAEREAVATALQAAAALRGWIVQYNAFDKLRVRRLGAVISEFAAAQTLPLVLAQRG
ncbi:hypothetical protein COJE103337_06610 [Corynebacterium jeikeium]|jgi:N-acetylglucosamine-6-phosphate deacetylase|uniref:Uncharacterized protein n=1 Tax=Corynebacterium jeikeium (strain K411) TaxID=306537 RepID=Q4JSH8_CORJK|nr:hypothetical protein [Corynebacterium jeikeium]EEW15654.1 hypothetical protein HMPREF0297_1953 [Corynebacterium jeikeium ATCC 43734]OOD34699.1 hypothetical protein BWP03_00105 [Corynebacterium jeikeium]WCZ54701.1 hypothetical protein CJEIK_11100 [Corynebacterium jeikeium]CAI38229.1 hypothetical protein jk2047 [Corynebacterium jeikeium K411]SUY82197.1 N-acetylglucosamine-6-phosphate deacetylase [Corynebacterium jeikeium]